MGYAEILMQVRTESFAAQHWPGRTFRPADQQEVPIEDAKLLHAHWVRFNDQNEPRLLGLLLNDVVSPDPVFVVVFESSDGTVRRSLWRYATKFGWRRLG